MTKATGKYGQEEVPAYREKADLGSEFLRRILTTLTRRSTSGMMGEEELEERHRREEQIRQMT